MKFRNQNGYVFTISTRSGATPSLVCNGWCAERGRLPLGVILGILILSVLGTLGVLGWNRLSGGFLERVKPVIEVAEAPRGIGVAPVALKILLSDADAGLDEVIIRTRQKRQVREVLKRSLGGQKRAEVAIEFPGDKSGLQEGTVSIEIRAFDRSFWSNQSEIIVPLQIDYRRPRLEIVTTQHNARAGGSQLVFYKAYDENLALSGVKVGTHPFLGYPARGLDSELDDPNLFVAIYGLDVGEQIDSSAVRLFAEDAVGNVAALPFYNKIQPRGARSNEIELTDSFLESQVESLSDANLAKIESAARVAGEPIAFASPKGGVERRIEKFKLLSGNLRRLNEIELRAVLKESRFERRWNGPFSLPRGAFGARFGERLVYTRSGEPIDRVVSYGYEMLTGREPSEIGALNDGIVLFAENFGVYGNAVGLDHGLGLVSVYAGLERATVRQGESVAVGQTIGVSGKTGASRGPGYLLQLRLHGLPVDPVEWWERGWYQAHINGKIAEVKRSLGIRAFKPLERGL